jgi:hypothetical protein
VELEEAPVTLCPCGDRVLPPELVADARFCPFCGRGLQGAGPVAVELSDGTSTLHVGQEVAEEHGGQDLGAEDHAAVEALPAGSAMLLVLRGPSAGSRFLLDTDTVAAGRHPDSDVFLDDVTVSRRHAEFHRGSDGAFTVRDVGSLNGTYVNRSRVDHAVLHNRDEVQIGKFRCVFYQGPTAAS